MAPGRVDESEQLRVVEEDINVMAVAMTNLDHHGRAAAKRPLAIITAGFLPKLVKQV